MLKKIIKEIIYREKSSPEKYIEFLKKQGCRIGKGTYIYASPTQIYIDTLNPYMIEIGENVQIARGVTILTHDYAWSVLKKVYGDVLGSIGKVKIGNNVFIGMNSTIVKGTSIGDNVIIGANSFVSGKIPSNCVIGGNPAKVICTIEEYYNKRKDKQLNEAVDIVKNYYDVYGKIPKKEILREYFWIFENRNGNLNKTFDDVIHLVGNYEQSLNKFNTTKSIFNSYEEFIKYCNLQ